MDGDLVHGNIIQKLMEKLQLEHTSGQSRLFTDSSKVNLKKVLLHNGNRFPSLPMASAVYIKQT
jgi:hypothetical protein